VTDLDTKIEGIFEFVAGPNRLDIVLKGTVPKGAGQPRDDANPPAGTP